jgi:hypothetical protein
MWIIFSRALNDPVSVWLLAGDILATVAVGFGIIWEHGPPDVRRVANRFVIGGIALETLCTALLFAYDANIIGAQNEKIIALEAEAGPRNLRNEDQNRICARLAAFPVQEYDLTIPPITDRSQIPQLLEPGSYLINHLIFTLSTCGWQLRPIEGEIAKAPLPAVFASVLVQVAEGQRAAIPSIAIGQLAGVHGAKIIPKSGQMDEAFALARELNKAHVWTDVVFDSAEIGVPHTAITANRMHILIGTKT